MSEQIDRLDAEIAAEIGDGRLPGVEQTIRAHAYARHGPDLKAEVLRLEEERDHWKQRYERVVRILADVEGDEPLILECDWGGCDNPMADIRYCPEHGDWLPVCENHTLQADALLEALEAAIELIEHGNELAALQIMRGALPEAPHD